MTERARADWLTLLALALVGCGAGSQPPDADPRRPDVLLIVVDTLRADRLGCYGYGRATSPALDRLAREGVRYDRAQSQAPWTTPSVGSLLTSRYPTELGILTERSTLGQSETTLAEALGAGGYATAAVVSHSFCSSEWNFDQGFERFDESNVLGHDAVTSKAVTARALESLDALLADTGGPGGARRPFFLWVHYFDPHFAYVEHPDFPFPGPESYAGPVESGMKYAILRDMYAELADADLEEVRRLYDSEVALTDHWIGALLDGLRARGAFEDTLVVATADHGEEFLDHGRMGHSRTLYQELVRVPLIVKYPRGLEPGAPAAGTAVERPVALLDVYPTVLAATGTPPPPGAPRAGLSLLDEGGERPLPLVSETSRAGGLRAVLEGSHKLIHRARDDAYELYDLGADPAELRDLAALEPERVQALRVRLELWAAAMRPGEAAERELDQHELDQLRKLGYLGED